MNNNDTFNHLIYLTGLNNDLDRLIELFASKGCLVTKSQIRSWRRKTDKPNSRPIPDKILYSFFSILFDEKNNNPKFFQFSKT